MMFASIIKYPGFQKGSVWIYRRFLEVYYSRAQVLFLVFMVSGFDKSR